MHGTINMKKKEGIFLFARTSSSPSPLFKGYRGYFPG